jgi:hypothetical protein
MRLPVATTVAFLASGAVCLAGFALLNPELVSPQLSSLFPVLGAYVVLGSLVLGIRSDRPFSTLLGLGLGTVALVAAMLSVGGLPFESILMNLFLVLWFDIVYGFVPFVAWVTFGLIGLHLLGHLHDPAPAAYSDS